MKRHLVLRLDAPLMAFGGLAVDNFGVTDAWPAASLLTGLIANALGYRRTDGNTLQELQDRLVFACRLDRRGTPLRDFQTADLDHGEKGWTTRGVAEGRAGGAGTYEGMHIRYRDFWADRQVTVALRLEPAGADPTVERIADALRHPARPLFIGRKPCLPSGSLLVECIEADDALDALARTPAAEGSDDGIPLAFAPRGEVVPGRFAGAGQRDVVVHGQRDWLSGVHGGREIWCEGHLELRKEGK